MRSGKSFLILLVVAAGLGYYAYFVEPTHDTSRLAALKEFSLDPPRISITFHAAGESGTHRVDVGIKTPMSTNLYAKLEGKPAVLMLGAYREDALNKSLFNLRDKTVLTFDRDGANFLKIDDGKKPIVLAKQDTQWRVSSPIDAAADFTAVDGLVGRLYQSRMKGFVVDDGTKDLKKYGLDKPQYTVTVGAGAARVELAIGTKAEDGNVYAQALPRPMIFTLEGTFLDDLKRQASEYRQKDVFNFRTFTALSLDFAYKGKTYAFARQGDTGDGQTGTWKQTTPESKDVDTSKASSLLSDLSGLRGDSFVDAMGAGDEIVVTAKFGQNAAPKTEVVTFHVIAKGKDGKPAVHAQRKGEKDALVLAALDFDKAMAIFKELTGAK